ncbi:restriction endonuclease subunit S [Aeribacillus composti]|uniref:restriction endonuclease subunit S n=1 Tax=Aeribacillus composti TaxID=1868734 RepID=UPI002E1DA0B8|nr:restriction endonuclease subunit S [Aeribacillus composti]
MSKEKQKSIEELLEEALVPEEEQPYKVPENWVWSKLGILLKEVQYGYTEKAILEPKGPRYLRITDLNDTIDWDNVPYCEISDENFMKYKLNHDDIVVARMGSVGKSQIIKNPVPSVFASYLIRIVTNQAISPDYLSLFMKGPLYWGQINSSSKGTTRANINSQGLKNLMIPLSPLNEQKRIAEKIERLFAKLDEAKRLIEEVKESFELRKISIIKKIIDEGKEDAQQRGWKFAAIKNIFEIKGGGTPSKSNESYWNGTIPWISAKDMKTLYIQETKDYITEEGLNNSSAKMVTKGSIAMVVRSGILQHSLPVAYLMTDCTVNQDLKVFNSGDELVNKYFLWYVKANEKYLLNEYSKAGTTVNSIEFEKFKSHIMSIPPREEIEKKIIKIESIVNKENEIKMYVDQILQLENLKHAILHKAFRGELGTNDPTDEHAIELLKKVLKSK